MKDALHGALQVQVVAIDGSGVLPAVVRGDLLSGGEEGFDGLIAKDEQGGDRASVWQAQKAFGFLAGIFDAVPALSAMVIGRTAETIALSNGVDIECRPASYRTIRGVTAVAIVAGSGCRVGLAPTGKRRLCTAHT